MRAYKVSILEMEPRRFRFVGSQQEAAAQRRAWMDDYKLKLRAIHFVPVDIPTNKADLIAFLNREFGA